MTSASTEAKKKTGDGTTNAAAGTIPAHELRKMDAYWRASNYLSGGQIYLLDNAHLKNPLKREHIKPRLLGHWGTSPGLNVLCVHLNRVIVVINDLDRFHLVEDAIDRLPQLGARAAYFKQAIHDKLIEHKEYINRFGDDMPAISRWRWGLKVHADSGATSTAGDNL
jgi:phosphoketolase